jgi:hypothetical protein
MIQKRIPALLLGLSMTAAVLPALRADTIGMSVNGTCEAGSCPPATLPFNSTALLPFDVTVTLPDSDRYMIYGSFPASNNSDGSSVTTNYTFQVTYQGNSTGGPSAADTITVERELAYETSFASLNASTTLLGAFSPGIAASSSASSCVSGGPCIGPVSPPGTFDEDSGTFSLSSTSGVWMFDKTFVSAFGAGSPVGSYIVWGQSTPIPSPVPEPAYFGVLAAGMGAAVVLKLVGQRPSSSRSLR